MPASIELDVEVPVVELAPLAVVLGRLGREDHQVTILILCSRALPGIAALSRFGVQNIRCLGCLCKGGGLDAGNV